MCWCIIVEWILHLPDEENKNNWDLIQKCIHGYIKNGAKVGGSGLKSHRVNKIQIDHPKFFFNKHPSLIIIPILTTERVRDWNGTGYSAIVLAGSFTEGGKVFPASVVCRNVNATYVNENNSNFLANLEDLNTATSLLISFLKCLKNGIVDSLVEETVKKAKELPTRKRKASSDDSTASSTFILNIDEWGNSCKDRKVCDPRNKSKIKTISGTHVPIRKITFDAIGDDSKNPAPDPILLLAKAGSNWMKRNGSNILPCCDDEEDDEFDDESFENYEIKPGITEVTITGTNSNGNNNSDTDDELTDDEDDF